MAVALAFELRYTLRCVQHESLMLRVTWAATGPKAPLSWARTRESALLPRVLLGYWCCRWPPAGIQGAHHDQSLTPAGERVQRRLIMQLSGADGVVRAKVHRGRQRSIKRHDVVSKIPNVIKPSSVVLVAGTPPVDCEGMRCQAFIVGGHVPFARGSEKIAVPLENRRQHYCAVDEARQDKSVAQADHLVAKP
eukprot:3197479-Prymnesium_polylepis.1